MKKILTNRGLFICCILMLFTACEGREKVTSQTLTVTITSKNGQWKVLSSSKTRRPYYHSSANAPVYQADLMDQSGKLIRSVFYGKAFVKNDSSEFTLPFPAFAKAHRIIIYRLDASSGHITNKNRDKVLDWTIPAEM